MFLCFPRLFYNHRFAPLSGARGFNFMRFALATGSVRRLWGRLRRTRLFCCCSLFQMHPNNSATD